MSEKRVAPPDGGSGDLVLIQRHLENLSAGEILEELDARMEEMTDQSCDPELIRLYLDVLEEKEPLGLELDPEASLQRFLEERAGEESTPPEEPEFTSLQEALDAYGITEPLVPKWLPEGFESLGVTTNVDPDFIRIAETYSYDEKKIKIAIRCYNAKEALERVSVEKENGQQDEKYIRGGVEHSLAQNRAIYTASWTNGLNIVSIIGDVTEEELEQMIDSIYT